MLMEPLLVSLSKKKFHLFYTKLSMVLWRLRRFRIICAELFITLLFVSKFGIFDIKPLLVP